MSFEYESSTKTGPLRQGELLGPLWDHQPTTPPSELAEGDVLPYVSIRHSGLIVVSQDCDLLWDYQARFPDEVARRELSPEASGIDDHPSCVPHVLLCDVYAHEEIRPRISGSDIWKRIRGNQDERYHRLEAATVRSGVDGGDEAVPKELPDLFLDFKKSLAVATRQLYLGLQDRSVLRIGVVPPIYLHDVIHRFYGYHSRVALPSREG